MIARRQRRRLPPRRPRGQFLSSTTTPTGRTKIIPRAVVLLDYSPRGDAEYISTNPTPRPSSTLVTDRLRNTNRGAADFLHGEAGDDVIHGAGNDRFFGEGQDDDLYGESGHDWISGGTGDDGVLGDDGRSTRAGTGPPSRSTGSPRRRSRRSLVRLITATSRSPGSSRRRPGAAQQVGRPRAVRTSAQQRRRLRRPRRRLPPRRRRRRRDVRRRGAGVLLRGRPAGAAALSAVLRSRATCSSTASATRRVPLLRRVRPVAQDHGPLAGGVTIELPAQLRGARRRRPPSPLVDDGKDMLFGDIGNDWLVGGTGRDRLFGGFGDDLLQRRRRPRLDLRHRRPAANDTPDPRTATTARRPSRTSSSAAPDATC